MFTVWALMLTLLAAAMIPHGGKRYTVISNIGCFIGIAAMVLWAVVSVAVLWRLLAWLWVHAP